MSKFKYSDIERDVQELMKSDRIDRFYLYQLMVAQAISNDDTATKLARKVLQKDIENILNKIQSLYQREDANFKSTEGRTDIDILIDWLYHINPDDFN